jgi:hypothetical protein
MNIPPGYDDNALRVLRERAGDHDNDAWAELLHVLAVRERCEPRTEYATHLAEQIFELLALGYDESGTRAALTGRPKLVGKPKNTTRDESMVRAIDWRVTHMSQSLPEAIAGVAKLTGLGVRRVEAIHREAKKSA